MIKSINTIRCTDVDSRELPYDERSIVIRSHDKFPLCVVIEAGGIAYTVILEDLYAAVENVRNQGAE